VLVLPISFDRIDVWAGPQASGAIAVVVVNVNANEGNTTYLLNFASIGAAACNDPRDLWAHAALPEAQGSLLLEIPPHGSRMLLLTPCSRQPTTVAEVKDASLVDPMPRSVEQPAVARQPSRRHSQKVALE
jgi:hypothetical protein